MINARPSCAKERATIRTPAKLQPPAPDDNIQLAASQFRQDEEIAVGCLLDNDRQAWPVFDAMNVNARWFSDERYRDIFTIGSRLRDRNEPVNTISVKDVAARFSRNPIDPLLLASLVNAAGTEDMLKYSLERLRKHFVNREVIETYQKLREMVSDPNASPEALMDALDVMRERFRSQGRASLPPIISCTALVSKPPAKPAELVYGLLHQCCKLVLGSGSKSFKTWCLLDLSLAVSHGEPWIGFKTAKGRVLYLNLEIQDWAFRERIRDVAAAKHITLHDNLDVWNLRGHSADCEAVLPRIKDAVKRAGYSLIIIDPVYKLLGNLDENSAGDMGKLMNKIESLAIESGAAVAFGAHFSKGNQSKKESIDRISGSGVFARDPDSIMVMTPHEEERAFVVEATLRNFKPIEPFVVRWDYPLFRRAGELDPKALKQPSRRGGRPSRYSPEKVLEALGSDRLRTEEWKTKAVKMKVSCSSGFYSLMKELEGKNLIGKDENERWYRINSENSEN